VSLVEQEKLTRPEQLSSPTFFVVFEFSEWCFMPFNPVYFGHCIALSVLLQFTACGYLFGILNLFLCVQDDY
jgi:hypothetical protein